MKICKKVFIAALVALATMGLGAQTSSSGAPVTLTVYMQNDLANPQSAYWPVTVEAFQKKYPNIKLEFEYVSGEEFHQKFQAMAASGDIPDLFTCYAGARSGYILDRGMVKDLRPYLTESFKKQYNPAIWQPQGPNGEIYIISPNMAVCTVVYINTKLQKQLGLSNPKTLDEMIAQVPKIRAAGLTPLAFGNKAQWQAQSLCLSMLVDRMGGTAWFDKAMKGTAKFTDKPFVDAIAVIKKMVDTKLFPAGVNQLEGPQAWGEFVQGKAVYLLDAGWRISALKAAANPADYATYAVMAFLPWRGGQPRLKRSDAGRGARHERKALRREGRCSVEIPFFIYGQEGCENHEVRHRPDLQARLLQIRHRLPHQAVHQPDQQPDNGLRDRRQDGQRGRKQHSQPRAPGGHDGNQDACPARGRIRGMGRCERLESPQKIGIFSLS
jgi:raffinose/stachyose/melibiose transport system substrate-binding protein